MAAHAGQSALLIGATGQVGRHLLRELLASPHFSRVGEAGRRVTPPVQLASAGDTGKLEQFIVDFEDKAGLQAALRPGKWDVVFITLGTNARDAGSPANFEKIDKGYVLAAATAAKSDEPGHTQRVVYCSGGTANPNSSMNFVRSKGLTEQGLAALGYAETIVFRPGMLLNLHRERQRPLEGPLQTIGRGLSYLSSRVGIDVDVLAKSMRIAGQLGVKALPSTVGAYETKWASEPFTIVPNKGALLLAKETP